MRFTPIIAVALTLFMASGAASASGTAINKTELFIVGFDIREGSLEEERLKDMAEVMGGAYVSAEDASTVSDLEAALIGSFAGISNSVADKVPLLKYRGPVAQVVNNEYIWGPQDFAGFYYDIDEDLGTESLTLTITANNVLAEDTGVVYSTEAQANDFGLQDWGQYYTISFLAEEYFAGYVAEATYYQSFLAHESRDSNLMRDEQLTKVLIDDDEERTVTTTKPLKLAEGYELVIQAIDADKGWVYVQLMKDGMIVDSSVVEPSKVAPTITDKTYVYKKDLGDTKKIVLIAVHFKNAIHLKNALPGADQDLVTIEGIWQISDTPIRIEEDTKYDKMTIQIVDPDAMRILMTNEDKKIILNKKRDISLMGNIRIKTADQYVNAEDPLRFYIYKLVTVEP